MLLSSKPTTICSGALVGNLHKLTSSFPQGAQVDVADSQGRTPLHIACRTENTSVVRTLLRKGADVSVVTLGELQSPLHYAARHDAAEVIDVLVEHGAQVNPTDFKGRTPLLLAAELDRSVAALKLLEHDAKAGIIDKTGNF